MRTVKQKSKNNIEVNILSGTKGESNVAKTFKKYLPYDLIADLYEGTNKEISAQDFLKDICATMGAKYNKTIEYSDYDFSTGYFDREHPKQVKTVVADKTSVVPVIDIINNKVDVITSVTGALQTKYNEYVANAKVTFDVILFKQKLAKCTVEQQKIIVQHPFIKLLNSKQIEKTQTVENGKPVWQKIAVQETKDGLNF